MPGTCFAIRSVRQLTHSAPTSIHDRFFVRDAVSSFIYKINKSVHEIESFVVFFFLEHVV